MTQTACGCQFARIYILWRLRFRFHLPLPADFRDKFVTRSCVS